MKSFNSKIAGFAVVIATCLTVSVFAQSGTYLNSSNPPQSEENNDYAFYRIHEDMMPIKAEQVPQSIRTTLEDPRYLGWQQGDILRTKDGSVYELRIGAGDEATTFRFDANGNPMRNN